MKAVKVAKENAMKKKDNHKEGLIKYLKSMVSNTR
jgi:hypothetical protein